jgi:hypothetical protein
VFHKSALQNDVEKLTPSAISSARARPMTRPINFKTDLTAALSSDKGAFDLSSDFILVKPLQIEITLVW